MTNLIWSYGGGTQSAAIAALIVKGDLPKPDIAAIADTGREISSTWSYLDTVIQPALDAVGVTIHRIPHSFDGSGFNTVDLWGGANGDTLLIPAFTSAKDAGAVRGFCSNEWKARPVHRFCKQQGIDGGDVMIGFSTDEMERCRAYRPEDKWRHVYPLIGAKMNRGDCIALVESMGWPTPPRSACWMCPYRTDHEWREMKALHPQDFKKAVAFEKGIQRKDPHFWLHRSCQPISEVDFSAPPDLFAKPCDSGMCWT